MYIIEDGRVDEDKKYRYFKCPKCGCGFIADKTEWVFAYDLISFRTCGLEANAVQQIFCACPTEGCGKIIYRDSKFNPKIDYNPAEDYI